MADTSLFDMKLDPEIPDNPFIFDNISQELEECLLKEQVESDSKDGLFSSVEGVTNRLQENLHELIIDDTNKKMLF